MRERRNIQEPTGNIARNGTKKVKRATKAMKKPTPSGGNLGTIPEQAQCDSSRQPDEGQRTAAAERTPGSLPPTSSAARLYVSPGDHTCRHQCHRRPPTANGGGLRSKRLRLTAPPTSVGPARRLPGNANAMPKRLPATRRDAEKA